MTYLLVEYLVLWDPGCLQHFSELTEIFFISMLTVFSHDYVAGDGRSIFREISEIKFGHSVTSP